MARMIPPENPDNIPHPSEQLVYKALAALPAQYVVMHSYPWLRPKRNLQSEPLRQGEADFVILHPAKGMLVVEVKGGEDIRLEQTRWWRGHDELKDPFAQADRNRWALVDAISDRTGKKLNKHTFTHGHIVCFPHYIYQGDLPHDSDPRIILDGRDLGDVEGRIEDAFRAWGGPGGPPTASDFAQLINALTPKLRLLRCVGADITSERTRLIQLSEDQRAMLRGLMENPRVLIEGGAGSGKTLLALEFAVSMAEQGKRTLFLCFNRELAIWLNEQIEAEPRLRTAHGSLEIDNFHRYARKVATKAGVPFDVPDDDEQAAEFWNDTAPLRLEQAISVLKQAGSNPNYDAVIVDEGQDFFEEWWLTVESLCADPVHGNLYVFEDLHQSFRGVTKAPPVSLPTKFPLNTNCRNTKSIARSAAEIIHEPCAVLPGAPEGEPPALHKAPGPNAQAGLVLAALRRVLEGDVAASQVALIGPRNKNRGALAEVGDVIVKTKAGDKRHHLVTDAAKWRRGEGVLVTTSRSFKGLEADVVILYDLQGFGTGFSTADLYVAWTRAKHRLIAVCHGTQAREAIESALAASQQ